MTELQHGLVGAYAADALDVDEAHHFEEHLAECRDCRDEVDSLREAAATLSEATAVVPPPALRGRVMADIATVRPLPPLVDTARPVDELAARRRRRVRLAVTGAAAAVVLTIGAGVGITVDRPDEAPTVSPAQRVLQADDALRTSLDLGDGARATVVHSESVGQSVIQTTDMPPPPAGSVYQLWYLEDDDFVDAGLMPVEPTQTVRLRGDSRDAAGVGITVEPAGGSPEPTTDPIATFDFGPAA